MSENNGKTLKIYIFRHGETTFNRDKIFTGWLDPDLTPKGIKQAEKVAEELKNKEFQVAYCSHLKRSKHTLEIVLKYHKKVDVIVDDRIIERSYGELQGRKHAEYIKEVGKKQFDIYHRSYDVPPPGGESIKMVEARVNEFIKDLIEKMKKEKVSVAISAHGNSMRPFRKYFENLTIEEMMKLENPWDSYFEYDVSI
ncbi:MAG: 2,3-bisphosphoglycerate-dependent phosphoglycerate mutase [Candidatus Helarchaeota archaeon]